MVQVIWWLPLTAALWLLPGYVLLRLAGVRGVVSVGAAASVTTVFAAIAATVYPKFGVAWRGETVLLGWVVIAGVIILLRRVILARRFTRGFGTYQHESAITPLSARKARLAWIAGIAAAVLPVVGVFAALPDVAAPLQVRDGFVHLNAVAHIAASGQASMFGGLDPVVSHAGAGTFYPSVWHAITALLPGMVPAQAVTMSALAVMVVVWPASLFFFARAAFPRNPAVSIAVVAVSSSLSFFPFTQHLLSAQSPNALGTALLPAALAATILVTRRPRSIACWALLGLTGAAAVLAHPNTVFSYVVLALPIVAGALWRGVSRLRQRRAQGNEPALPRTFWWWSVTGALVIIAASIVFIRYSPLWPVLRAVMNYEQTIETRSYLFTTARLLSDVALWQLPGNILISVAVLVGVVSLLRRRTSRWLVAMWLITITLAAIAGGPENALRGITGFWYKHVFRLEALYPISALLLAAVGFMVMARWLATRDLARGRTVPQLTAAVTVTALVLSLGTGLPGMVHRSRGVFDPAALAARDALIVDVDDREMLDELAELLPQDAVVIADPMSGGVLASGLGGVSALYQRTNIEGLSVEGRYLADHFAQLGTDPQVCQALQATGVEYAYLDDDLLLGGTRSAQATTGFAAVDTGRHMVEIARSGSVGLYRIAGCD